MIKKSTIFFLQLMLIISFSSYGQIPSGYYSNASGLTCQALKTALKNIIIQQDTLTYTPGVWNALQYTDIHRNDNNTADIIWDMYSDNPAGSESYTYTLTTDQCGNYVNEGDCYNREHTLAQSWFNSDYPMKSDLHEIYPTDGKVNGVKDDFPYGEVSNPTFTSTNGGKFGPNTSPGYSGNAFEPRDVYKGDFARALLYIAVRYEDLINSWYVNANADVALLSPLDEPDATERKLQVYDAWYLKLLIKWHRQDPVSQKEIDRNNAIFYQAINDDGTIKVQGNRNPFIDHPEYADLIWQCTGLLPVTIIDFTATRADKSVLLNWEVTNEIDFKKYEIEESINGISFKRIAGIAGENHKSYSYEDKILPPVNIVYYRLKMLDADEKYQYSKTIAVRLNNNSVNLLAFPNPATNKLTLQLKKILSQESKLVVSDIIGRTVKTNTVAKEKKIIVLDVSTFSSGKYLITITNHIDLIKQSFLIVR